MAKLYWRYGTVGAAKSLNLLAVCHNYERQDKTIFTIKPAIDVRFGRNMIQSRTGLKREADLVVADSDVIVIPDNIDCVLGDEAQFFHPDHIDQLRDYVTVRGIPVIVYGLLTDFTRCLFPASKRLVELADSIEEMKTTCQYCNKKAIFNRKLTASLEVIDLGTESKYVPTCDEHYAVYGGVDVR